MVVKRQQELLKRVRAPESIPGLLQFAAREPLSAGNCSKTIVEPAQLCDHADAGKP
jgi:hypothetical protein